MQDARKEEDINWGIGLAIVGLLFMAFALVGNGDYVDKVTAERDELRADLAQCRGHQGGD